MAKVTVGLKGQAVRLQKQLASRGRLVHDIAKAMRDESVAEKKHVVREWPVLRNQKGLPMEGAEYREQARKKGHNILEHSRDLFVQKSKDRGGVLSEVVSSPANWAFVIRSRQVGEPEAARRERYRRDKGQKLSRYYGQSKVGTRRHAWTQIGVKPHRIRAANLSVKLRDIITAAGK